MYNKFRKLNNLRKSKAKEVKMYKYLTVKENLFHIDIGPYAAYGIVCIDRKTKRVIAKISDVSVKKSFVKNLARKFTRLSLPPEKLLAAVEIAL